MHTPLSPGLGLNENMEFMKINLLPHLTPSGLSFPPPEVIITEGLTPLLYSYIPTPGWEMTKFPIHLLRTLALGQKEGLGRMEEVPLSSDSV